MGVIPFPVRRSTYSAAAKEIMTVRIIVVRQRVAEKMPFLCQYEVPVSDTDNPKTESKLITDFAPR